MTRYGLGTVGSVLVLAGCPGGSDTAPGKAPDSTEPAVDGDTDGGLVETALDTDTRGGHGFTHRCRLAGRQRHWRRHGAD